MRNIPTNKNAQGRKTMEKARLVAGAFVAAIAVLPQSAQSSTFKVVYGFSGSNDGVCPQSSLVAIDGVLYGMTERGGKYWNSGSAEPLYGGGTVFKIDPKTGAETVLHAFGNGSDAQSPLFSSLINVGGTLYGTTFKGGKWDGGALFQINPATGAEKVLHSFGDGADGANPATTLLNIDGRLYGTTTTGGIYQSFGQGGTVFKFDVKTGVEAVLYSFSPADSEGSAFEPWTNLIDVGGMLYGTTLAGGPGGDGTVFKVNPTNATFSVVHTFAGGEDGFGPQAGVIDVGGYLYGTTMFGGSSGNGNGTVFKVSPSTGKNTVIHRFGGGSAAPSEPMAALLGIGGVLYGTTYQGGAHQNGTIFKMGLTGEDYDIVYAFGDVSSDGGYPQAALINVGGVLYGTACAGGQGGGVVFSFTP
jgi:uncharacterized repeat protein (TIGR03803 family)